MGKAVSFGINDKVDIMELVDKATRRPVFTVFLINRKIERLYQHRVRFDGKTKVEFICEHISCPNAHVAAGYELATKMYGKPGDPQLLPMQLRMTILGSLPEPKVSQCSNSIQAEGGPTLAINPPAKPCETTGISQLEHVVTDHTSTVKT